MYPLQKGCRICAKADDTEVAKMDEDLLKGMDFTQVLLKYSGRFDGDNPLTRIVLFNHRKHIRKSLPFQVLGIPDMSSSTLDKVENTNEIRSAGFDNFADNVEGDKQKLDMLFDSAIEDLMISDTLLSQSGEIQDSATVLMVRNHLRKALKELVKTNREMTSPVIGLPIGDTNKKLFVEFLLIVKKAAEAAISDETVKSEFFLEITSQLRKSKEFKYVLEEERDRREITENIDKEASQ